MPLTEAEQRIFQSMIKAGVLTHVKLGSFSSSTGTVLIACCDGHQFDDLYEHIVGLRGTDRRGGCIHPVMLTGGALLLAPESHTLTRELKEDQVILKHMHLAFTIKGEEVDEVSIYVHRPCGLATAASIDFQSSIARLIAAKNRIKAELERYPRRITVPAFLHTHQANEARRTYIVSGKKFKEWEQNQ